LLNRISPAWFGATAGAVERAEAEGSPKVTTRHQLQAALHDPTGSATRVLEQAGGGRDAALAALGAPPPPGRPSRRSPSTDRDAKAAHRRAIKLAGDLRHPQVDVAHLLYGLAAGTEDPAALALRSIGITPERVRAAVAAVVPSLGAAGVTRTPPTAAPPTPGSSAPPAVGGPAGGPATPVVDRAAFGRFDPGAQRAVVVARDLARAHGRSVILPAHLALGALQDPDGPAARAVAGVGGSTDALVVAIDATCAKGGPPPVGHLPFEVATHAALLRAVAASDAGGGGGIDSVHLLAGVLGDPAVAATVSAAGIDVAALIASMAPAAGTGPDDGRTAFWPPWFSA